MNIDGSSVSPTLHTSVFLAYLHHREHHNHPFLVLLSVTLRDPPTLRILNPHTHTPD